MAEALRADVLPAVDDSFARSQVAACIELLGNISTRVDWRADYLTETSNRARRALDDACAAAPELAGLVGDRPAVGLDRLALRDAWLATISRAIRACGDDDLGEAARAPLLDFAAWHLESESALLRTGMFGA